jgi:sulfite exporter TauE/SafE
MPELPYLLWLTALLTGLSGGVHCVGMCGGVVTALSFATGKPPHPWRIQLSYNLGRLLTYTLLGTLAGATGHWLAATLWLHQAQQVLELVAGLFLLLLGLYLGNWWHGLRYLEQIGAHLWRHIQPLGRRYLPIRTPGRALIVGMIWGFLPCGLVYSALIWSLSAGSALAGGLLMLSFGLGTLPTLLTLGTASGQLTTVARHPWARRVAGALVLGFGLHMLLR